jgi:histidinol-phosphate aminotransferase
MTEPSPPPEELHARLEQWIRPELRSLAPYHVADASGCIKLDAMENPYPWPGTLTTAWLERLSSVELNRYPRSAGQRSQAGAAAALRHCRAPCAAAGQWLR